MKRFFSLLIVSAALAASGNAQTAPNAPELTRLLNEFLAGASRNDPAVHDRFWAEDLIYTGSSGRRIGKADIMRDARPAPPRKPEDPTTTYTAEDIRVQQYGNTAIVAFRLVAVSVRDNNKSVANYLNTGTFIKRSGKWQAVSWQATKMPRAEDDARNEVSSAEAAFHKALLAADTKRLESLIDPGFVWTHQTGEQVTRRQLLEQLGAGRLKYSKLETSKPSVSIYADTAIVRGESVRRRGSIPDSASSADGADFTVFYTLTFVNSAAGWKAVALHTSRR